MISITTFIFIQLGIIGLGVLIFIIRNIFIKNIKLQKIINSQDKYLMELYDTIKMSEARIEEIDSKQIFQGDDEVGFFFQNMKKMQKALSEYIDVISIK